MSRYTASAGRLSENVIQTACEEGAPLVVRDLAELMADVLAEHPDVRHLTASVEVQW